MFTLGLAFLLLPGRASAQYLQPGFDKVEYIELLKVSAAFGDSAYVATFPKPERYDFVYRSPVVGLDNRWDLWVAKDKTRPTAVVSLRGTTANSVSWLGNFYAAMVPAKGELTLGEKDTFPYELATNPAAAVHVGWLVSMAILSRDIRPKLDSCYRTGIHDFILMGHSQGGAINYLLTAYLYNLQKKGELPADLRFKTYCSAGPKPGNLYFAYDYEAATQAGWAYNVVNSADWVPEVPLSIQTLDDFNVTNPFVGAKGIIKKQKFPNRVALKYVYNRLSKPSRRAQKNYQKYLGNIASGLVQKNIAGYTPSEYYNSNNYVRTGNTIVLLADADYYQKFPDSAEKVFTHHFHPPYLYLAQKLDLNNTNSETGNAPTPLEGTWEANYVMGSPTPFAELYPNKKPALVFDLAEKRVSGNTGCNQFSGPLVRDGKKIQFSDQMTMTRMFCPGGGETLFLKTLNSVNSYAISPDGTTLSLIGGDVALMRLTKK
ncbi:META domain-containing protein [Cytophagaceae bacterium SJW1-29]|uniref:META domain-containing protein n=1 Tax=Salmonirosea aquatica TaxID=2654236 RepID=A0A7C9BJY7_9BACT|nr:META domain-containing protein [Cytophagaceae bacterium SJW1-29]